VSRDSRHKAELVAALTNEMIESTTVTIMFHQAIADRLGMNITDHKCAGILMRTGPISAGELAKRTGLTTGAITGVIDRLQRAGFARRAPDATDRRKVMIEPNLKGIKQSIIPLFESMGRSAAQLFERYTVEELTLILEFAVRSRAMAEEETRKLRETPVPSKTGKGWPSTRTRIKS
jgi:DNA-binding MarR family transcriptional regulator